MPTGIPLGAAIAFVSVARNPNGASAAVAVKLRLDQSWRFIFLLPGGSLLQVGDVVAGGWRAAEWLGACYVIDARGGGGKKNLVMAQENFYQKVAGLWGGGRWAGRFSRECLEVGVCAG